jgi:hypothetical protein
MKASLSPENFVLFFFNLAHTAAVDSPASITVELATAR